MTGLPPPPPAQVVWRHSAYDGEAHMMTLEEVSDSTKRSYAALCKHTAPRECWTVLPGPVGMVHIQCVTEAIDRGLMVDPAEKPRPALWTPR